MPSPPLSTVGLAMPDDFPFGPYEAVNARVSSYQVVQAAAYTEFAGAWRAIPYRFYAVADHGDAFTQSIAHHGATVPAPQRYLQERELFNFFVNGLAAIESFCYGLFAIGAIVEPNNFHMTTEQHLHDINPRYTRDHFGRDFAADTITATLGHVLDSTDYHNWQKAQDLLARRSTPRRSHSMTLSVGDAAPESFASSGQLLSSILLDANTTADRRAWLAATLKALLTDTDTFTTIHL